MYTYAQGFELDIIVKMRLFKIYSYLWDGEGICGHTMCMWVAIRTKSGYRFPQARVTVYCELPSIDPGNQTWVLWKRSKCSLLSYLSTPYSMFFVFQFSNKIYACP